MGDKDKDRYKRDKKEDKPVTNTYPSEKRTWKAVMKFGSVEELKEIIDRQYLAFKDRKNFELRIKLSEDKGGVIKVDY